MDTVRDMKLLNALWESGKAPWARWEEIQTMEKQDKKVQQPAKSASALQTN
jgi:hypothetical protein